MQVSQSNRAFERGHFLQWTPHLAHPHCHMAYNIKVDTRAVLPP